MMEAVGKNVPLLKHSHQGTPYYLCKDGNDELVLTAYEYDSPFPFPQAMLNQALGTKVLYIMVPGDGESDSMREIPIPEDVISAIQEYLSKDTT